MGWPEVESLVGGRVDRRRSYWFCIDADARENHGGGAVYTKEEYTTICSGCRGTEDEYNGGEYPWDDKAKCYVGSGCCECGYTGKRRWGSYCPVMIK